MAAVIPQIIAAPQPPRSSTEKPSDPSRKPGFARQITNPSYQRSVFRSWRSSTTASATFPPLRRPDHRAMQARAAERNTCLGHFQRPAKPSGQPRRTIGCGLGKPPITIKCDCGETRDVAYGERWGCETCGRSWNTQQIPAEEYAGLLRRVRRHKLEALAMTAISAGVMVPLIVVVSSRFLLLVPMV